MGRKEVAHMLSVYYTKNEKMVEREDRKILSWKVSLALRKAAFTALKAILE